ncbi:MAG: HAD-IIA family hydrolase [Haloquadratum sp.]
MGIRGVIFDVDGTLVRGDEPIPGVREGLAAVEAAGLRRLFVSNNPTKPPAAYERRLGRAGIDADASAVITAGTVTARYLAEHHPDDHIAVVGEPALVDLFRSADLSVTRVTAPAGVGDGDRGQDTSASPDVLVASLDQAFGYETLRTSLRLLEDPAVEFVGTDPDVVIPAADGNAPGSGAVIDAIANVARRDPDVVLGKPSEPARRMVRDRVDLRPEEVLVVGDRLDTDVALGERAGMQTALVCTGVDDAADVESSSQDPDYVLSSLSELADVLGAE